MASGNLLREVSVLENIPPTSNPATPDTRNLHPVLDFDDSTDEFAVFSLVLPSNYTGGGLTIYPRFSMTSATSGNVVASIEVERIGDGQLDIDGNSFSAANTATIAVPATSGNVEASSAITFTDGTDMASIAAGEQFRLRFSRDANNGSDTATGDLELHGLDIYET